MVADREECPCCGKEIVAGTFEYQPVIMKPLAVDWVLESEPLPIQEEGDLLAMSGRWFLRVEAPLPLGMNHSPVRPVIWVEIDEALASSVYDLRSGNRTRLSGAATLACDLPGFPGTIGALARFRIRNATDPAQLIEVADQRVQELPEDPTHEQILELYRQMWGADNDSRPTDTGQRNRFLLWWEDSLGRTVHRRTVQPPPRLSGTEPGEMLFSPPLDTGGVAIMVTLGCSDIKAEGEDSRKEIACWARNPSEEFLEVFSEFVYITRMNKRPIQPGYIVPEREPLSGPEGDFSGWVLCRPWWIEQSLVLPEKSGNPEIEVLGAVPLYPIEMAFAAMFGPERLLDELQAAEVDPTSLSREAVAPGLDGGELT